jgi:hypothetical protein
MHVCIECNTRTYFTPATRLRHNAFMHKVNPVAGVITELARRKGSFEGRRFIKDDGALNATVLADAMAAAGYKVTQPTIHRILKGDPDEAKPVTEKVIKAFAGYFKVKDAVIRGEIAPIEGMELSTEARHFAQSFDEMPHSIRQFLTDVRDAWVRLKDGDPFLAEQILEETNMRS